MTFHDATDLPGGQRAAFYWLTDRELDGDANAGSVFTLGDGAHLGYRTANLAADAVYHAGLAFARPAMPRNWVHLARSWVVTAC